MTSNTAPPEVLYTLIHLLCARGIDMTHQRNIARMAHGINRGAALWLGSADARTYQAAADEAREITRGSKQSTTTGDKSP